MLHTVAEKAIELAIFLAIATGSLLGIPSTQPPADLAVGGTHCFPQDGCTGTSTDPTTNDILIGNSTGVYDVKTLTAGSNVTIDNSGGTVTISSSAAGGGGSGSIGTSTVPNIGELAYFTTSGDTPELVSSVATTSLTATSPLALSNAISVIGDTASALSISTTTNSLFTGSAGQVLAYLNGGWTGAATTTFNSPLNYSSGSVTLDTSGTWSGNAGTATALAANGSNCSSGNAPLGVDASGAVESCFDVWTEAENTSAGYISGNETITLSGDVSGSGATSITTALGLEKIFGRHLATSTNFVDGDIITWGASGDEFIGLTCAEITGSADLCDGTDATGSGIDGFDFSYNQDLGYGITGSATSTATKFTAGLIASSTSYFSNASTTLFSVLDAFWVGANRWDNGSGALDGEIIANDTIDDDSIDFTDVTLADFTFDVGSVDTTEFGYLNGVTSAIQTQLNAKLESVDISDDTNLGGVWPIVISGDNVTFGGFSTTTDSGLLQGIAYIGSGGILTSVSTSSPLNTDISGNAGTATALAANGANCSAGNAPLGVDASGAVESCTDFEEDLSNEAGLYAALSDVTQFWEAGDTLSSGSISSGFGNIDIGSSNLDADGTITFGGISDGCVNISSGILGSTGSACGSGGGGDPAWATTTPFAGLIVLYPADQDNEDVVFGDNSGATTTAPFWWDVSATTTYIGTGGGLTDSFAVVGPDVDNQWIFGYDVTDKSFAIASSTALGTSNAITIAKSDLDVTLAAGLLISGQLGGVSSLDATTESSIESALDTLNNLTDIVVSTSLQLPNGTSPTVNAAGEAAVDTTADQLLYYSGGAVKTLSAPRSIRWIAEDPSTSDEIWLTQINRAITVTEIVCIVDPADTGESVEVTIQERNSTADSPGTTNVMTCDNDGATDTTITDAAIDADDWIGFNVTAVTGTVSQVSLIIYYEENRQ